MTRLRHGAACVGTVALGVGWGCGGGNGPEARDESSAASGSTAATTTSRGSDESSTTSSTAPDDPEPPPPLPEGEVVCTEPTSTGKHWCWQVVALPPEIDGRVHNYGVFAADLDGDGKDSLLLTHHAPSDGSCSACLSVLDWTGADFVRRQPPLATAGADYVEARTYAVDYDGDGDLDLVHPQYRGKALVHVNDAGVLQPHVSFQFHDLSAEVEYFGYPLPMNPRGDGRLDLFVVTDRFIAELHRRDGDNWHPVPGQRFTLPNCGEPQHVVSGDFDEDGALDYGVMESGGACDYMPKPWDPGHPVISIYLTDPATGTLRAPTWVPVTGDLLYADYPKRIWVVDLDRDGHLDLVFRASDGNYSAPEGPAAGIGYSLGRGDGTFEAYEVILPTASEAWTGWDLSAVDIDGDGSIEVVASKHVIADLLGDRVAVDVPLGLKIKYADADLNGDGLVDLVLYGSEYKPPSGRIVLMSVPVEKALRGG